MLHLPDVRRLPSAERSVFVNHNKSSAQSDSNTLILKIDCPGAFGEVSDYPGYAWLIVVNDAIHEKIIQQLLY